MHIKFIIKQFKVFSSFIWELVEIIQDYDCDNLIKEFIFHYGNYNSVSVLNEYIKEVLRIQVDKFNTFLIFCPTQHCKLLNTWLWFYLRLTLYTIFLLLFLDETKFLKLIWNSAVNLRLLFSYLLFFWVGNPKESIYY